MRVRAKTVLATVLVTFAVLSNLLLVQSLLASAGAEVRGPPEGFDWDVPGPAVRNHGGLSRRRFLAAGR